MPGAGGDGGPANDPRGPFARFLHRVFLCDLNTPWDLHLVSARSSEITSLAWDESGSYFCLSDSDGSLELWQSQQHLLSRWKCVAKERLAKETFVTAKFVYRGKSVSFVSCTYIPTYTVQQ